MVFKKNCPMEIAVTSGLSRVSIKSKDCLKVLGMKMDSCLTWRNHISQIKSRATNAIKNIARTRSILPLPSRMILTNALVVPHYNYGDIIYDGCTAEVRKDLERNQNYAARSLLGRSRYSSATSALRDLHWIPLSRRREIHQSVFIHKALRNQSSHHAVKSVSSLLPQHSHSTRHKYNRKFNSQQHSSALSERSTIYKATHAWNSIPSDLRDIESTKTFKTKLQNFMIDNYIDDHSHVGKPY